jgi:hypothetical protein
MCAAVIGGVFGRFHGAVPFCCHVAELYMCAALKMLTCPIPQQRAAVTGLQLLSQT